MSGGRQIAVDRSLRPAVIRRPAFVGGFYRVQRVTCPYVPACARCLRFAAILANENDNIIWFIVHLTIERIATATIAAK